MSEAPAIIEQLRYVRLGTADLDSACRFATEILGLEPVGRSADHAWFRSDDRDHTVVYVAGSDEQVVGLEVRDTAALSSADDRLAAAGFRTSRGDAAACELRRVKALLVVDGPGGQMIEFVVRPLHTGWRYFPTRDSGITGLTAVALRCTAIAESEAFWTAMLGGAVRDWAGESAYIGFDPAHHRIALHPSSRTGILAVEFAVESIDQVMQASYFLPGAQVRVMQGPGRRPTSGQIFLTFEGPDGILYSVTTEAGEPVARPRQFGAAAASYCCWGSENRIEEFEPR
jgi:2,3-dihydroxy-p-cumate/2,3-dihydroxybenzoate 3,4-dioxygenase